MMTFQIIGRRVKLTVDGALLGRIIGDKLGPADGDADGCNIAWFKNNDELT